METPEALEEPPQRGRLARSTAFFSIATAASRIAGLVREIVAASYYGINGPMSAFTIAFQVPNLVRSLFADAALQPAFVPVFTEQLEQKNYREAFRLASTLLLIVTMVLGAITALFVLVAPVVMPLFAPGFKGEILDLTVTLSQVLFPILILLGISGVVVGILNSYDRFGAFAISPLFWNLTIIAVLVFLEPAFHGQDRIYAYAIGILAGTLVQLLIPVFDLRHTPFKFNWSFEWRNPGVRRVLLLMLPVTISLGLINFNMLINSLFGSLVSDQAPAAIDKAFRIYQLPQGIFSVAIATVLFPTLARYADARRDRRPAGDDGQRDAADPLRPAARRRRRARPLGADDPARLPARRLRRRADDRWSRRPSSGSPSRCPPTGSTCSRPAPSSASSGPGWRPAWPASTSSSRRSPRSLSTSRSGWAGSSPAPASAPPSQPPSRRSSCAGSSGGWRCGRLLSTTLRIVTRLGGPGRGCLRRLGRPRPGPGTRPRRPDRLPRHGARARWADLSGGGEADEDRRAGADNPPSAPPLDAQPLALPAGGRRAGTARRLRHPGSRPASAHTCFLASRDPPLGWRPRCWPWPS